MVPVASAHTWLFQQQLFSTGATSWRVHSIFDRAVNFQVAKRFVCLTMGVDGPATIVIKDRLPALSPGARVTPSELLDLSTAEKWLPPEPVICADHLDPDALDDLRKAIAASGRSALLQHVFRPWLTRALSALGRDFPQIPAEISQLIGLGPGMTPSGDDFLAGYCHALSHAAYGIRWSNIAVYTAKTSAVSRHMIRWACHGVVAAPFEDILFEMLHPSRDFHRKITAALAVGHFSGADHLLGVWSALRLICKRYGKSK